MAKLEGKTALITGSDSGIGQATAIEFARHGADVVICYHSDREGAERTALEVKKFYRKSLVLQVDIAEESSVEQMFDAALDAFGALHILVNNAAVPGAKELLADMSTGAFDRTIRTNVYGAFFCCRRFIRHRRQDGGGGRIINVTSVHEEIPMIKAADYCASKGGVRNLTRTLALEIAKEGITVNNIAPGMILTPMNQEAIDDQRKRDESAQHIPMKRPGRPEEVARLALFLASPDADYVTGSTYFIDGGLIQNTGQGA